MTAALERKIKRRVLGAPHTALVRFPRGFGDICLAETEAALAALRLKAGMTATATLGPNAVEVSGAGFGDLLALALKATTAREILWHIHEGKAASLKALRQHLATADWDLFLPPGAAVAVRVESTASWLFHEGKVRDEVKAALAARGVTAVLPKGAEHLLDVRLLHDRLSLAMSLAGRPLYQRHYKAELGGSASVKEDVAAAATLVALAFIRARRGAAWRPELILAPFAGSGTLGFEALLALQQIPPCLFFGPLSAERFPCCPQATARHARRKLVEAWLAQTALAPAPAVRFVEKEADVAALLQRNCEAFNGVLAQHGGAPVAFDVAHDDAFAALTATAPDAAVFVALNPPYGRRLKDPSATRAAYAKLGKLLRKRCAGRGGGYAMLPDPEGAQAFTSVFGAGDTEVRAFLHGGKTTQLVAFCPL